MKVHSKAQKIKPQKREKSSVVFFFGVSKGEAKDGKEREEERTEIMIEENKKNIKVKNHKSLLYLYLLVS